MTKQLITNNWVIKNHREPQHLNKHQRNMNWNIQSTVNVCDETKDLFNWFNTGNGFNGHGIPEASSRSNLMANISKPLKSWGKNKQQTQTCCHILWSLYRVCFSSLTVEQIREHQRQTRNEYKCARSRNLDLPTLPSPSGRESKGSIEAGSEVSNCTNIYSLSHKAKTIAHSLANTHHKYGCWFDTLTWS